ncbi:MAG: hypothetical protein V4714_13380 [Bacteroidota bacterium]
MATGIEAHDMRILNQTYTYGIEEVTSQKAPAFGKVLQGYVQKARCPPG